MKENRSETKQRKNNWKKTTVIYGCLLLSHAISKRIVLIFSTETNRIRNTALSLWPCNFQAIQLSEQLTTKWKIYCEHDVWQGLIFTKNRVGPWFVHGVNWKWFCGKSVSSNNNKIVQLLCRHHHRNTVMSYEIVIKPASFVCLYFFLFMQFFSIHFLSGYRNCVSEQTRVCEYVCSFHFCLNSMHWSGKT